MPASLLCMSRQSASSCEAHTAVRNDRDYELREDGTSRCTDMVQRTAELGLNTRTMFLPTLFWVSKHEDGFFERTVSTSAGMFVRHKLHVRLCDQCSQIAASSERRKKWVSSHRDTYKLH